MMSDLAPGAFERVRRGRFGRPYLYVRECRSTQELLRGTALPEGAVAVAEHQSAGRGRAARRWEDVPGASLLCSVLLRPQEGMLPQLSLVAALSVAEAVEQLTGREARVKWPNDVLLDGRKVAGILLERVEGAVVVGIGVNVGQSTEELPRGTRVPPGSLRLADGVAHDRGALLAVLLQRLEEAYAAWSRSGLETILPALHPRDALRGLPVRIGATEGTAAGLAEQGGLVIELASGERVIVESGEVELGPRVDVDE